MDGAVFYDVHDPERTIVIELDLTLHSARVEVVPRDHSLLESALGRDAAHHR
jgi:hypothetical protein